MCFHYISHALYFGQKLKNPLKISGLYLEAEEEGFEPPEV